MSFRQPGPDSFGDQLRRQFGKQLRRLLGKALPVNNPRRGALKGPFKKMRNIYISMQQAHHDPNDQNLNVYDGRKSRPSLKVRPDI